MKTGYDPNQPRNEIGEWAETAGSAARRAAHLHILKVIRTQDDVQEFISWLAENNIQNVQGFAVHYFQHSDHLQYQDVGGHHDAAWLWSERKMLNDWIKTQLRKEA
jgi:hypothetical protein